MNDWILYTLLAALLTLSHGVLLLLGGHLASRKLERGYLKALLKRDRKIINRAMQMVSEDESSSIKRNFKLTSENRRLRTRMFELAKKAKQAEEALLTHKLNSMSGTIGAMLSMTDLVYRSRHDRRRARRATTQS